MGNALLLWVRPDGSVPHRLDQCDGTFMVGHFTGGTEPWFIRDLTVPCLNLGELFAAVDKWVELFPDAVNSRVWTIHPEPLAAPLRLSLARRGYGDFWRTAIRSVIDDLCATTPWDVTRRLAVTPQALELLFDGTTNYCNHVASLRLENEVRTLMSYAGVVQKFLDLKCQPPR